MPCNEYAKPEDVQQIRTSLQQAARQKSENDRYVWKTIDKCLAGKFSEKQAKEEIIKTYGQDPRAVAKAIGELENRLVEKIQASTSATKSRPVNESDIRGVPSPSGPVQKDGFGRSDQMPDYHPNPDAGELKGFESGEWARPGEHGKILVDKNDPYVQSVHMHRYENGFLMTVHYRNGHTEAYDQYSGEQVKDRDYSKPTKDKPYSGM